MNRTEEAFFEEIYQKAISRQKKFLDKKTEREHIRKGLQLSLGPSPEVDGELKVKQPDLLEKVETDSFIRERFAYQTAENLTSLVYVLTPKQQKEYPAVLALHGHGYGSREIVGLTPDGKEDRQQPGIHQHFAVQLVNRGLKVIAPEIIGFGDRMLDRDRQENKPCSCDSMAVNLLAAGGTLPGLRVFEALRMLDLIAGFADVKKGKTGIMGFSGGGLIAACTAALDERIQATVLTGFANTFKGSILAIDHCIDNYLPGILTYGELPDILGLIAPRPLFVEAGKNDPIFPVEHAEVAISQLKETYHSLQSGQYFDCDVFEGSHEISGRHSYDWLKATLEERESD